MSYERVVYAHTYEGSKGGWKNCLLQKKRERERIDFYSEQARKFNMNEKEKLAAAAAADVIALNHVMLDLWPTINSNKQVNVSFAS